MHRDDAITTLKAVNLRFLLVGLIWTLLFLGAVAFGGICKPLSIGCLPLAPIWSLSTLVFFGVPTFMVEVVLAFAVLALLRPLSRKLITLGIILMGVDQIVIGLILGARYFTPI